MVNRLVEAAEAVDAELSQEGARDLREEERRQVQAITEELETLSLAIVYDDPEEGVNRG